MKPLRDLLKHSSIYAIGQILARIASVLLLPLYTHCLTPEDYGITAIMDLTATILSLMIGGGMVTAVTRFHFEKDSEQQHDALWWTGLSYILGVSVVVLFPLWLGRQTLSDVTLGADVPNGSRFYEYTLATILVQVVGQFVDGYLRVLKWSGIFVMISLGRLFLNVGLNIWFLVGMDLGVEGLLLGNFLASAFHTIALLAVFLKTRGRFAFQSDLAIGMVRFSMPLVVTALLAMLMHEADRYLLRALVDLKQLGIYSLAHKIGFAVNTLCLMPFSSIWHVAIYDIERLPNANQLFSKIFDWFVAGVGILLLGAALTVHPILPLLTPDAYGDAIDLISVILLGFFVFGLQLQFEVPALLHKKTALLVPGSAAGVIVNISGNLLLIPMLGLWGAGWTAVLTYAAFSFTTLFLCRQISPIPYRWGRNVLAFSGLCVTYMALRYGLFPRLNAVGQLLVSVLACGIWALVLFGEDGLAWWRSGRRDFRVIGATTKTDLSATSQHTEPVTKEEVACAS
ncbi:MAG: lipopolysaccharide biosynthesis protein [Planctomycetota bacterium]